MEGIVKQTVNCDAVDNANSSRLYSSTEPQEFAQSVVDCLMKTPTFTARINKLIKKEAEIFMNEEEFYNQSTNV